MSYVLAVKLLRNGLERFLCFLVLVVVLFFPVFWMPEHEAVWPSGTRVPMPT